MLGIRTQVLQLECEHLTEPSTQPHMGTSFVFVCPYVYGGACTAAYMGKRGKCQVSCSATTVLVPRDEVSGRIWSLLVFRSGWPAGKPLLCYAHLVMVTGICGCIWNLLKARKSSSRGNMCLASRLSYFPSPCGHFFKQPENSQPGARWHEDPLDWLLPQRR